MADEKDRPWRPLTPAGIGRLFAAAPFPWWIAGGIAIEAAANRALRDHTDIDVLVLRRDQTALRRWLARWDCWVADPPGTLRPWPADETLADAVHDIWCRERANEDWRFQVMLDESVADAWRSRRDARITRPLAELGLRDASGIRFLRPEVVLYYKAKAPRPIDLIDFDAMLAILDQAQRLWLADAIALTYGDGHAWLHRL